MPMLETVSIDLPYGCKDQCRGCGGDESCEGCHGYPVGSYQSVLLNSLSNAVNLELKDQPKVYIYRRDLECCPIFGRLKTLLLDMWCRAIDLHALVRILQHTPILEKLTLQLRSDENFLSAARGESRKHVRIEQSFACAHLKEVNIECEEKLRVKDKVRQIVKICVKMAYVMSKSISRRSRGQKVAIIGRLYHLGPLITTGLVPVVTDVRVGLRCSPNSFVTVAMCELLVLWCNLAKQFPVHSVKTSLFRFCYFPLD